MPALVLLIGLRSSPGGGIINPDAPTVSITRGLLGGVPVSLAGTQANPPTIFTWLENPQISGTRWSPREKISIHLFGPLNSLGVAPSDLILPTFLPTGQLVTDNAGNFTRVIIIPNGQRPGNYLLHAIGSRQFAQSDDASIHINICPQTVPRGEIQWATSRGGREGQLGDHSPERTDPEWLSAWSEKPVALYATVAETVAMPSDQPANQPSFISHEDLPYTHFAHDWNMELLPDLNYLWVLGTANFNGTPGHANFGRLECEWETQNNGRPSVGSYGHGNIGMPLWVTPSAGDQIYMVGSWILDNGHPDTGDRTEFHPVRMIATTRQRNTAIPFPPTGCMTRASQTDIYVSGHGGGANMFPDGLENAIENNGLGGGDIRNVLNADARAVYFSYGPADSILIDLLTSLLGGDDDLIKPAAGPSAFGWVAGPEERGINDMDYDFDVLLPRAPAGATQPGVRVTQHAEHTTAVNEVITYTTPDPATGLPTLAHIHLPYHGADSGIYARTLNFYWDKMNPPGRHFVVKMNSIGFFLSQFLEQKMSGSTYLWTDVSGQWVFLSELDPRGFLHATDSLSGNLANLAPFDVYVDPGQTLSVFTQGYDQEDFDSLFGVDVGKTAYAGAVDLAETSASAQVGSLGTRDGENVDLGGALFRKPPVPLSPAAGGDLGHHVVSVGFFYMDFNISYVREPHLDVTDTPVDFGGVAIGASQDRIIRIGNAAVGVGNNDPYLNSGVDSLVVDPLTVSGAGYSIVPAITSATVDAGQHQDITVRFTPSDVNEGAGTLTLKTNDPCQPVKIISLNATVISPQVTVTTATTLFPATVVGCANSQTVTVSNTGGADLIVSPSVSGAGYSLSPYLGSGTEGIRLAAGASIQLTVNFAPEFVARAIPGTLTLTSNDPVNPTATVDFCGEGTPMGIRVLVLQRGNGRPYPIVDQIMLQSPTGTVNRLNVPLTVINPPESCQPIQFHYETASLLSNSSGHAFDRNAPWSKKSGSTLHITIKNKHRTINLNPQSCDFQVIVVTM